MEVQKQRLEDHINWWTEDKIIKFLKEAGFNNIFRSRYTQSISPYMRNFDGTDINSSLYMETIK